MSEFCIIETQISNQQCLEKALTDLQLDFEVHEDPVSLRNYMGHQLDNRRGHIIVRKEQLNGVIRSDIGFERMEDGTFRVHCADMAYQGEFINELEDLVQRYTMHRSIKHAEEEEGVCEMDVEVTQEDKVLVLEMTLYD